MLDAGAIQPRSLLEDALDAEFSPSRVMLACDLRPARPGVAERLIGSHWSALRGVRAELEAARAVSHGPLLQLLDDLPVVLVVADWAWSRWPALLHPEEAARRRRHLARFEGVCVGFRPGSSALDSDGSYQEDQVGLALPGVHGPDADAPGNWHAPVEIAGVSLRRARCIDVWREAGAVHVEATFQDSATRSAGGRGVVHEYTVGLVASGALARIARVQAIPHVLPFPECLGALAHVDELLGTPCADLREAVPRILARTRGCTHLNDALRALAAVPELLGALDTGLPDQANSA